MKKIAIVHYHLNPGGVTRVIENMVLALDKQGFKTVVLSGENYCGDKIPGVRQVQGLDYSDAMGDSEDLAEKLLLEAKEGLGGEPDLWHFHNHSLGKNSALPGAVYQLAQKGFRMVLQVHDFAEDGRPKNFHRLKGSLVQPEILYPIGSQVHYVTINLRDLGFLTKAGIPLESIHYLPNAINSSILRNRGKQERSDQDSKKWVLYPTRGIRRKNLGELLLWAALEEDESLHFATTLLPLNPEALPIHDFWKNLARSLQLPIEFGLCETGETTFCKALEAAHAVITTSISEAFGFAFLEPWILDKGLLGRNIEAITTDFSSQEVDLSTLYSRVNIPINFLDKKRLEVHVEKALNAYYHAYDQVIPGDAVAEVLDAWIEEDCVDFGSLDEPFQESIVRQVVNSKKAREQVKAFNALCTPSKDTIFKNKEVIEHHYNLSGYGERLAFIYGKVWASVPADLGFIHPNEVLKQFLEPKRFNLLRT